MNNKNFENCVKSQFDRCSSLLISKGDEYDNDTNDRLHTFKVAASLEGETPKQALAGMMAKHTISIYDMCMSDEKFSLDRWNEKITDHINYLILLKALVEEENNDNV